MATEMSTAKLEVLLVELDWSSRKW